MDLAKVVTRHGGKLRLHVHCVLTNGSGETITAVLKMSEYSGLLDLSFQRRQKTFFRVGVEVYRWPPIVRYLPLKLKGMCRMTDER